MYSDKDIDALIDSVSREIENADALAKSKKDDKPAKDMKKDEILPKPEDEAAPPAAVAAAAEPPADAPAEAPAAEAPAAEAPAAEAPAPNEAPPEEASEGDAAEGEMSDEELMQIYSSMPPEELERHVMVAQQVLEQMKGGQEGAAPEAAPPAAAPAPEAMAMSEKNSNADLKKAADEKDKKIETLEGQVDGLKKSVEMLTKVVETGFRPVRKSVAGVEFTSRGGEGEREEKPLSKKELITKLKDKVKDPNLSKADREAINTYCLYGTGQAAVEKLISGGK